MTPIFDEIRAKDLADWADQAESERLMPSLIQQLILSSGANVRSCRFLSHEQTNLSGWDGICEAEAAGLYVPEGKSGWELSRRRDVVAKADEDMESRSANPGELALAESTFIVVTLRLWPGKGAGKAKLDGHQHKMAWAEKQRQNYGWRDVCVLDAEDLHAWLLKSPGAALWLAQVMGKTVAGARSLLLQWKNLEGLRPGITPGVFLAGRSAFTGELDAWLAAEPVVFEARTWSSEDLRDAIAAWWVNRSSCDKSLLPIAPVAVHSRDAWDTLARGASRLLLLADEGLELSSEQMTAAVTAGHFVINRVSANKGRTRGAVLPPLQRDFLSEKLRLAGFDNTEAWRVATTIRGSGVALKRILSGTGPEPPWAQSGTALAPLVLIGAWDANQPSDRERVAAVFGKPYEEVEATLNPWRYANEPLVRRDKDIWRVVAREEAWRWLSSRLGKSDFERFTAAATQVLSEINPRYDLPAGERFYSNLHDATPAHSRTLHKAIAETLCLLALRTDESDVAGNAKNTVRRVVTELLAGASDWRLWVSLDYSLTYIAEAAPDLFLETVETDLRRAAPVMGVLLQPAWNGFDDEHFHTDLMWALESLLWEKATVLRSMLVLARLAILDQGANMNPRPAGVLQQALSPWYPQCCLDVTERCAALDRLVQTAPEAAWDMLLGLLPTGHGVSSEAHRPAFRGRSADYSGEVSPGDYWQQVEHTARLAVSCAGMQCDRWTELVGHLGNVPEDVFDIAIEELLKAGHALGDEDRCRIWRSLRQETARHRFFVGAKWQMDAERCSRLEAVAAGIAPACPVMRSAWLFGSGERIAPGTTIDTPHTERDQMMEAAQAEALRSIFTQLGMEGFRRFLAQPEVCLAYAAGLRSAQSGVIGDHDFGIREWLESSSANEIDFACGFAAARFNAEGWDWIESQDIAAWSPATFGLFAAFLPCGEDAWTRIEKMGSAYLDAYWKQARVWIQDLNETQAEHAVESLIRVGRPVDALELSDSSLHGTVNFTTDVLLKVLEAMLRYAVGKSAAGESGESMEFYYLKQVFECLQQRAGLSPEQLEKVEHLECAFLPVLKEAGSPQLLLHRLWSEPSFFVELLEATSWPDSLPVSERSALTEELRNMAAASIMLLDCCKGLPGRRKDGTFDDAVLNEWLLEVRRLAATKDRAKACDRRLGKLFLYSPVDQSSIWPCSVVCELLESGSPEMRECFRSAIFNNQGWPGLYGDERTMSSVSQRHEAIRKLLDYAAKLELQFPVTSELLRKCAQEQQHVLEAYPHDD